MNSKEESKLSIVFLALLFLGGLIGLWQTIKSLSSPEQQRALTPVEIRQLPENVEATNQKATEQTRRDAGITPSDGGKSK